MGGSIYLWYLHVFSMHWYFLISSYYLTVLNGRSLTVLKSVEVTQHSGSFKWGEGVNWQIYPKSANFELTCRFMLCFTEGLFVLHTKDLIKVILWVNINPRAIVYMLQAWVLNKMQAHRPTLKPLIKQACDMVHRDQFNQSLMQVNLVEPVQQQGAESTGAMPKSSHTSTKYAQVCCLALDNTPHEVALDNTQHEELNIGYFVISSVGKWGLSWFHGLDGQRWPLIN